MTFNHKESTYVILLPLLVFFMIFLSSMPQLSTCLQDFTGSVSCIDCPSHHDFSGTKVVLACEGMKELATTTTKKDGSFLFTRLPSNKNIKCHVKIMGDSTNDMDVSPTVIIEVALLISLNNCKDSLCSTICKSRSGSKYLASKCVKPNLCKCNEKPPKK